MPKPKLIIITGPTASGKTALATTLAKEVGGIILTADSRQIYRGMNIGTSKVFGVERVWSPEGSNPQEGSTPSCAHPLITADGVDHFLVNLVAPDKPFTLHDYTHAFWALMNDLDHDPTMSDKPRFLVGGTGLYISSLIHAWGLEHQKTDSITRKEILATLEKNGLDAVVRQLKHLSAESASRIDLKNPRRVIRALEHVKLTGTPWNPTQDTESPLDYLLMSIRISRDELTARINKRVDEMIENGFLNEVQTLLTTYDRALPSLSAIGYKELSAHWNGELTLDSAVDHIKTATRQYAKRQMTWWRNERSMIWVKSLDEARQRLHSFVTLIS